MRPRPGRSKKLPFQGKCWYDGKRVWRSRARAEEAVAALRRNDETEDIRLYWCSRAGAWHVTSTPRGEFDRRQVLSNGRNGMTDRELRDLTTILDEHAPRMAESLPAQEMVLKCPCGEPITIRATVVVRRMQAGERDPAAELLSLQIMTEHCGHARADGVGMYVVKEERDAEH